MFRSASLSTSCSRLTLVLAQAGNLGEELDEVGQVVSKELGSNDEVLAGVVAQELRA